MSIAEPEWVIPTTINLPSKNEVQIWRIDLDASFGHLAWFQQTLSTDEKQRAERFRFQIDRHRFITSRGILRTLLGRYLEMLPADLQFCYGVNGKPSLQQPERDLELPFNVSHSQNLMLCAIANTHPVGVDVEYFRSISDLEGLTCRFFSPQEHQAIHSLPLEQRSQSFFQYWTCKEALLKAIGKGLVNLSAVEIAITKDAIELVRMTDADALTHSWQLHSFIPASDAVAAIAANQRVHQLTFWQWQDDGYC